MVAHLSLKGEPGKRGLMYVPYYARSRAFIAQIACSLLSHETLHLAINKFSLSASADLDNLFGRSNSWELYKHGLGDLDKLSINSCSLHKNGAKKPKKSKKKGI
jgi:hypothetical protein